jgi:hypothetical protein
MLHVSPRQVSIGLWRQGRYIIRYRGQQTLEIHNSGYRRYDYTGVTLHSSGYITQETQCSTIVQRKIQSSGYLSGTGLRIHRRYKG